MDKNVETVTLVGKIAVRDHILCKFFQHHFGDEAAQNYQEAVRMADAQLEAAIRKASGD